MKRSRNEKVEMTRGKEASAPEVKGLREENDRLKHALAETVLEVRLLKKSLVGSGSDDGTSD